MYTPFERISDNARTWIFTSEKELDQHHIQIIHSALENFTSSWQSHNKDVVSSFTVTENHFIIIAADNSLNDLSGCGIDKAMHVILGLEQQLGFPLTNKALLCFKHKAGIKKIALADIRKAIASGEITEETPYYNTLITSKADLNTSFLLPAGKSWLKKYFVLQTN